MNRRSKSRFYLLLYRPIVRQDLWITYNLHNLFCCLTVLESRYSEPGIEAGGLRLVIVLQNIRRRNVKQPIRAFGGRHRYFSIFPQTHPFGPNRRASGAGSSTIPILCLPLLPSWLSTFDNLSHVFSEGTGRYFLTASRLALAFFTFLLILCNRFAIS